MPLTFNARDILAIWPGSTCQSLNDKRSPMTLIYGRLSTKSKKWLAIGPTLLGGPGVVNSRTNEALPPRKTWAADGSLCRNASNSQIEPVEISRGKFSARVPRTIYEPWLVRRRPSRFRITNFRGRENPVFPVDQLTR